MLKHFDKTCKKVIRCLKLCTILYVLIQYILLKINNIRAAANALRLLLISQASSTAGNIEIYTFM